MAAESRPVSRSRLLTNPVAEFLETRESGDSVDTALWRPNSSFVPEIDQFVPDGFHSVYVGRRPDLVEYKISPSFTVRIITGNHVHICEISK